MEILGEKIARKLQLKTVMQEGRGTRRKQEREKNAYVKPVGPWLQRLLGPGSQEKMLSLDELNDHLMSVESSPTLLGVHSEFKHHG